MFYIFIRACKKYEFDFIFSTCGGLAITLYPRNTFENINISQGYYKCSYRELFSMAIKEMKKYREERCVL